MMEQDKNNFDLKAENWDTPTRKRIVHDISQEISRRITLTPAMKVLDFGCGTGLLTLSIRPSVGVITGTDSSRGMLDILEKKLVKQGLTDVFILHADVERGDEIPGDYDLIVSGMTLHHIRDVDALLRRFYTMLNPGGYAALADIDTDGGLFHENGDGVYHNGFDRVDFRRRMSAAGFADITIGTATDVTKTTADGEERSFTLFLASGRKG